MPGLISSQTQSIVELILCAPKVGEKATESWETSKSSTIIFKN